MAELTPTDELTLAGLIERHPLPSCQQAQDLGISAPTLAKYSGGWRLPAKGMARRLAAYYAAALDLALDHVAIREMVRRVRIHRFGEARPVGRPPKNRSRAERSESSGVSPC